MMERRIIRGLAVMIMVMMIVVTMILMVMIMVVMIMVTMIMVVKGSDPHDHHWRIIRRLAVIKQRLSSVDCALHREILGNDVCGNRRDLAINMVIRSIDCLLFFFIMIMIIIIIVAINMVIRSDDCFIGWDGRIKKKPPWVGIAGEPYFSLISMDQNISL